MRNIRNEWYKTVTSLVHLCENSFASKHRSRKPQHPQFVYYIYRSDGDRTVPSSIGLTDPAIVPCNRTYPSWVSWRFPYRESDETTPLVLYWRLVLVSFLLYRQNAHPPFPPLPHPMRHTIVAQTIISRGCLFGWLLQYSCPSNALGNLRTSPSL